MLGLPVAEALEGARAGEEGLVAHHPSQHVEDPGALVVHDRPEDAPILLEAPEALAEVMAEESKRVAQRAIRSIIRRNAPSPSRSRSHSAAEYCAQASESQRSR